MAGPGPSSPTATEVRSCPNCLAAGAWSGRRCVYCGTRFVCKQCGADFTADQIQHAQTCPACGTFRDLPHTQAPATSQGASTRDVPRRSLLDTVRDVLAAAEPVQGSSLREARVMLARALLAAGRATDAAKQLQSALREDGPVSDARLLLERSVALLQAGDEPTGTRAVLRAVQQEPARYLHLALDAVENLKPAVAAALDTWIVDTCIPAISRAMGDAGGVAHLLAAANEVGNGRYDDALDHLTRAASADRTATLHYLDVLASPTASADLPGGEVALATFRARAFADIGDRERAVALAGTVIENALTGEGYPEAEAYEIRGRAPGRSPTERAADLLEAGRLIGSRGEPADLRRSVALLQEAAALDPTKPEIHWYLADNLRLSSYDSSPPAADVLLWALDAWGRGQALNPNEAWPYLLEAALCEALGEGLGDADADQSQEWSMRALRAAVDGVLRDQEASLGWAWLSRRCRRLDLWATASFAMRWCETAAEPYTSSHDFELEERVWLSKEVDPDGLLQALDEYETLVSPTRWSRQLRAVALLEDDRETAVDLAGERPEDDFSPSERLIQAYVYAMVDDPRLGEIATEIAAADVDEAEEAGLSPLDPAWLALWRHDLGAAARLAADATDPVRGRSIDSFQRASFRLQLALLSGEEDPVPLLDDALRSITAGELRELGTELAWVARALQSQGRQELLPTVESCQTRVAEAAEELPRLADGEAEDALSELDGLLFEDRAQGVGDAALTAARALVSRFIGLPITNESDWPSVLTIQLGPALVPSDAESRWQEWPLFTELIPRCRDDLRRQLGFPVMGIEVRPSLLGDRDYEVQLNGESDGVREVPPHLCPDESQPLDSYPRTAPWEPAIDRLTDAVLRRPAALFVPRTVEVMVEEWREQGAATAAVARVEGDLRFRIAVWQRLHSIISERGRLPEWEDGLSAILASMLPIGGLDD